MSIKKLVLGDFLVVQWPRLHTPNGKGPRFNSAQGTRFQGPKLIVPRPQIKILNVATKTQCVVK